MIWSSHPEVFYKKVFLEILQNSQENTCARASFLIKLQAQNSSDISINTNKTYMNLIYANPLKKKICWSLVRTIRKQKRQQEWVKFLFSQMSIILRMIILFKCPFYLNCRYIHPI